MARKGPEELNDITVVWSKVHIKLKDVNRLLTGSRIPAWVECIRKSQLQAGEMPA